VTSVHDRLICVEDTAVAVNAPGGASVVVKLQAVPVVVPTVFPASIRQ